MVTRKAPRGSGARRVQYGTFSLEDAIREGVELVADDLRAEIDGLAAKRAPSFEDLDRLEAARDAITKTRWRKPVPVLDAARAIHRALEDIGGGAAAEPVARRCITELTRVDRRFGTLTSAGVTAQLARFHRVPSIASVKGRRTIIGILAELSSTCRAFDLAPGHNHDEAADRLGKRYRRNTGRERTPYAEDAGRPPRKRLGKR